MTSAQELQSATSDPGPLRRLWRGWIKPAGMAIAVIMTLRSAVADWNDVPSQSMEPTILVGDRIVVNKLAYDLKVPFTTTRVVEWARPKRGDVVVFFSPADGKRMVKRIVGLPGDRIEMRNNRLIINGRRVTYQTVGSETIEQSELADPAPRVFASERLGGIWHLMMTQPNRLAQRSIQPLVIPEGRYFVMGDNRDNSGDSRSFGVVPRDQIVGKAVGLAFSLDADNSYLPRWKRFFKGL